MGLLRFMSKIGQLSMCWVDCARIGSPQTKFRGSIDAAKDGSDGSPIENEANAVAGVIIMKIR
jgi:hypothetical protein